MSDERILLTKEEAIELLGDREDIHTFRSGMNVLIGADHSRASLLDSIEHAVQIEIGGEMCKKTGHGLVVWTSNTDPLFVEADKEAIEKLESLKEQLAK
jgi:hypothetical protein